MPRTLQLYQKQGIIKSYLETPKSFAELGRLFNCSAPTARDTLKENNILTHSHFEFYRTYSLDVNYFNRIDTSDKAYFLGLLYADGCNLNDKCISISLKSSDIEILNTFKKYINSNKPLQYLKCQFQNSFTTSNAYRLVINSSKIGQSLNKLGMVQRKTNILVFPTEDQVPKYLLSHFIRGYFDGDGCISVYKDKDGRSTSMMNIAGTMEMVLSIQKILMENCNLSKTKIQIYKNTDMVTLRYGGNQQVKRIYDYLYKDCKDLYIERKKEKFESI